MFTVGIRWIKCGISPPLKADALFTLLGTTLAAASAVGSFFGMNLRNHHEVVVRGGSGGSADFSDAKL